jgi:hypothetical protein
VTDAPQRVVVSDAAKAVMVHPAHLGCNTPLLPFRCTRIIYATVVSRKQSEVC